MTTPGPLAALYRVLSTAELERLRLAFERDRQAGADRPFVEVRLEAIAAELRRRAQDNEL